ncbi:MAG: GNAT family N-acetyltransferase [Bacteroidales bacterium]|nr:GNAT family N-acetyltransferase [Bacteroidales bacterium]
MKELREYLKSSDKNTESYRNKFGTRYSAQVIDNKTSLTIINQCEKSLFKNQLSKDDYFSFLNATRKSSFLRGLGSFENRNKWAELVFKIIQKTEFSLLDLIKQRVDEHPDKVLFNDRSTSRPVEWTYKQVFHKLKEIASFLYFLKPENPRVALFLSNSIEGAISDLACLSYDIFNTPLNIHFNSEILNFIFTELDIDIVITDTKERSKIVSEAAEKAKKNIKIIVTQENAYNNRNTAFFLNKDSKRISSSKSTEILNKRKRKKINQVATTMFTSGSTGMPKGVSFSIYNIVSKRFARAAALPQVGENEKFICYLPLFHTFGRYLELTGSIFWGGTYIFTGNTSSATLLSLFPEENPTGFISVPIRWVQMYEKCISATAGTEDEKEKKKIIRKITGQNLHWGLSAAGYLDPKIFRFFHRNGITLNSGFGMTEATGGVSMTPSDDYKENSTGIPLPGIETRLKKNGELEIKGHYLAKYLKDAGPEDIIPYPNEEDHWLSTGDIFKIDKNGYHEIIDRVKDIYKNNKGQTISPGMIEKKFAGVPGIKRTFLIGDGKPYNVLLIVPDNEDPLINSTNKKENIDEYFHQIVTTANKDIAPYERVINFSIIERDFSKDKDELTPKGSFKRKVIEKNFTKLIEHLYKKNYISFKLKNIDIIVPRWFYRDLGTLETDISLNKKGLYNKVTKKSLRISITGKKNIYTIGDLNYKISDNKIDLGRIVRQPKLWAGNPELISFSPCKESFDLTLQNFSSQICVPSIEARTYNSKDFIQAKNINDPDLLFLNGLLCEALHTEPQKALRSLEQIEQLFPQYEKNKADIIRRRLEALACHNNEELRIAAYRILLTKDPEPDYSELLPAFINSGKTFLSEQSIKLLAKSSFTFQHLGAFRQRMHHYRTNIDRPSNKQTRKQFDTVFKLLLNFGINHPRYYKSIRAEFASWILLKQDSYLSKKATEYFYKLFEGFSSYINKNSKYYSEESWDSLLVFDDGISEAAQKELKTKLASAHTLKQAVILIYDDFDFDLKKINKNSVWVSRVKSYRSTKHYRMSINTVTGKHYDLHISIDSKLKTAGGLETLYRMITLDGNPTDRSVVSSFGCSNPQDSILISGYLSMLTAWDKIRTIAEVQASGHIQQANAWRKIFIRSISAFLKAWCYSNREILPGFVSPGNVALPENDFSDNAVVISLSGWKKISKTLPLFSAILQNFYNKTIAHYPIAKNFLKIRWIFHACVEAFGKTQALEVLHILNNEIKNKDKLSLNEKELLTALLNYFKDFEGKIYFPLPMFNAVDRYAGWLNKNTLAGTPAKQQTISELFDLYGLSKYPEIVKYRFYRETFFIHSKENVTNAYDILLNKMSENINILPIQLIELSELQSVLNNESEKNVFGKLVFPDLKTKQKVDILTVGDSKEEHVIVRSVLTDKKGNEYIMREPLEAYEVGELYELFFRENYPKEISKPDKHYIVTDSNENVIGGLCYKELDENVVLIDGMAVISPLHGKGLGSAMMEDFFIRMKAQGVKTIKAHFLFGNYYLKHNFVINKKWGALVREL